MSEGAAKSLKISSSVDTASFAKAIAAVRELTREVEKLAVASSKINFGGGMGMKISSNAAQPGGPSSIAQMSAKFGTGNMSGGGVANSLAQGVAQAAALFKTSATGSTAAFKMMQDGIRQMVTNSGREINALTSNLQRLEQTYAKLQQRAASGRGGALTSAAIGQVQELRAGGMSAVSAAQNQFEHARALQIAAGNPSVGGGAGPRGGGGGGIAPPGIPGRAGGAGGGGFGGLSTLLGGAGLGFLGAGTVLAGAIGAANFGLSSVYQNREANLQYGIGLQSQTLNRQATYGNIYGGNAVALSHGDIALSHAMRMAAKDKEYARATAMVGVQAQKELINLQHPTGLVGNLLKGGVGGIGTVAKSGLGNLIESGGTSVAADRKAAFRARMYSTSVHTMTGEPGIGGYGGGAPGSVAAAAASSLGPDFGGRSSLDIANLTEMQKLPEQLAQQRQDALQKVMQRNPLLNSQMQEYYGGALGDLNMARMARTGGGLVKDPRTGLFTGDAVQNFKERAIRAGWDPGQVAAMQQQIGGTVGWAAKGVGAQAMLSKQMGGFGSALSVAAMGNQFGGNGGGLVNAIAGRGGMVGRGGLDITAGSNIAGLGAGMMGSGNFAGSGLGLMQTLGAAGFTGSSGGDMLQSRAMSAGIGAMDAMMGGNIDPLSKGLNSSAAMKAAPNAPYATHAALMSLDSGTMMAALKSGSVPPELLKQGVTLEILKKYVSAQSGTAFARYADSMGSGTEVGSAIERYKKSGGNLGYMKSWSLKRKQDELNTIGLGMKLAGIAPSIEAGVSRARLQAASEGILKTPRGRGAFAVGAGAARKAALTAQGRLEGIKGEGIAEAENEGGLFTGAAKDMPKNLVANERQRIAAQAYASDTRGAGGVEGAIASLDVAFRNFVAALRGDPQISGAKMGKAMKAAAPGGR